MIAENSFVILVDGYNEVTLSHYLWLSWAWSMYSTSYIWSNISLSFQYNGAFYYPFVSCGVSVCRGFPCWRRWKEKHFSVEKKLSVAVGLNERSSFNSKCVIFQNSTPNWSHTQFHPDRYSPLCCFLSHRVSPHNHSCLCMQAHVAMRLPQFAENCSNTPWRWDSAKKFISLFILVILKFN